LFKTAREVAKPRSTGSAQDETLTRAFQDPTMGWGVLAAGGVRVVEVPGTHLNMVSSPHVETLALRIKDCLNGAEAVKE
jgi:thioesterase domain-containing protein